MEAAEHGDIDAQFMVGIIYSEGKVVERNKKEAFKWFMKSAEQGLIFAQNKLAAMHESVDGVESNVDEVNKN